MEQALKYGEDLGADLVEVRGDDVGHVTISSEKMTVKDTRVFRLVGVGVRAYVKGATGYSFTTRLSKESVMDVVRNSVKAAKVASGYGKLKLKPAEYEPLKTEYSIDAGRHPSDVEFEEKKEMLLRGEGAAKDAGVDVATTRANYGEASGTKFFMNSEGADVRRQVLLVSIGAGVVSRRGDVLVDAGDSHGGTLGLEAFKGEYSPEQLGRNAGKWAAEKLVGKKPPIDRPSSGSHGS